jgi:hypothetical protein
MSKQAFTIDLVFDRNIRLYRLAEPAAVLEEVTPKRQPLKGEVLFD